MFSSASAAHLAQHRGGKMATKMQRRKMSDFRVITLADFNSGVDEGNGAGICSHQMEANWTISQTDWPQLEKRERTR